MRFSSRIIADNIEEQAGALVACEAEGWDKLPRAVSRAQCLGSGDVQARLDVGALFLHTEPVLNGRNN